MVALGWGMAAAIGAVAGMLIAPVVFLEPNMMLSILLYGFAAAVVGGLNSPLGAVVGGFSVGVIENLAGTFIPYVGRELKLTIALALIVAVLDAQAERTVRPSPSSTGSSCDDAAKRQGCIGRRHARRDDAEHRRLVLTAAASSSRWRCRSW